MALKATKAMSKEEEARLLPLAKNGDKAAQMRVITSVLNLIRRDIHRRIRYSRSKEDIEDLEHVCLIACLRAIEMFDLEREAKFSTYAGNWWVEAIRQHLWKQQMRGRVAPPYYKVKKVQDMIAAAEEGAPSPVQSDVEFGITSLLRSVASLDVQVQTRHGEIGTLGETISSHYPTPEEEFFREEFTKVVRNSLDTLTEKEQELIRLRYLNGRESMTLGAIARGWGLSKQQAEKVEKKAFRRIKAHLTPFLKGSQLIER